MPPTHNSHLQSNQYTLEQFYPIYSMLDKLVSHNSASEIQMPDHNCQHSQTLEFQVNLKLTDFRGPQSLRPVLSRPVLSRFLPSSFQKSKCVAAGFSKYFAGVVWQQALELWEIANSLIIITPIDK